MFQKPTGVPTTICVQMERACLCPLHVKNDLGYELGTNDSVYVEQQTVRAEAEVFMKYSRIIDDSTETCCCFSRLDIFKLMSTHPWFQKKINLYFRMYQPTMEFSSGDHTHALSTLFDVIDYDKMNKITFLFVDRMLQMDLNASSHPGICFLVMVSTIIKGKIMDCLSGFLQLAMNLQSGPYPTSSFFKLLLLIGKVNPSNIVQLDDIEDAHYNVKHVSKPSYESDTIASLLHMVDEAHALMIGRHSLVFAEEMKDINLIAYPLALEDQTHIRGFIRFNHTTLNSEMYLDVPWNLMSRFHPSTFEVQRQPPITAGRVIASQNMFTKALSTLSMCAPGPSPLPHWSSSLLSKTTKLLPHQLAILQGFDRLQPIMVQTAGRMTVFPLMGDQSVMYCQDDRRGITTHTASRQEAVRWDTFNSCTIITETGGGKSLMALLLMVNHGGITMFVVPPNIVQQVRDQCHQHLRPDIHPTFFFIACVADWTRYCSTIQSLQKEGKACNIVINPSALRSSKTYAFRSFVHLLIVDEAHRIKPGSTTYSLLRSLPVRTSIMMSATPDFLNVCSLWPMDKLFNGRLSVTTMEHLFLNSQVPRRSDTSVPTAVGKPTILTSVTMIDPSELMRYIITSMCQNIIPAKYFPKLMRMLQRLCDGHEEYVTLIPILIQRWTTVVEKNNDHTSENGIFTIVGPAEESKITSITDDCPICMDLVVDGLELCCKHIFCTVCISALLISELSHACPNCRAFLGILPINVRTAVLLSEEAMTLKREAVTVPQPMETSNRAKKRKPVSTEDGAVSTENKAADKAEDGAVIPIKYAAIMSEIQAIFGNGQSPGEKNVARLGIFVANLTLANKLVTTCESMGLRVRKVGHGVSSASSANNVSDFCNDLVDILIMDWTNCFGIPYMHRTLFLYVFFRSGLICRVPSIHH